MQAGGEDKIWNNEKSRLISTKIKQLWTQKFYRYKNQYNDDDYVDDMK